jgi:hypothetical protein
MSTGQKMTAFLVVIAVAWWAFSSSEGYNFEKYKKYRDDAELSDAVHEWVDDYVERNCYAELPERGEPRMRIRCD